MPLSPFPPRPAPSRQTELYGGSRSHQRVPPNASVHSHLPPNDAPLTPRSILRPSHDSMVSSQIPYPQPPPIPRSTTTSPYHHHHTSSSPELRQRADNVWAPRVRPYSQQHPPEMSQARDAPSATYPTSHVVSHPRGDREGIAQRRSGFTARVNSCFVPGIRGRSASDIRIAHTPPPDLDPDRLARACGQPTPTAIYPHDLEALQDNPIDTPFSRLKDLAHARNAEVPPSCPPLPKIRVGHMYRRLDALARRSGRRAMDYIGFEDMTIIHKRDNQFREQLRRKRSERLQEKDPSFHAIGAPLEDVLLYASTIVFIGDYQYHLPVVVVACIEELTKNGIYQSGLFRALPSRDRHLQLIDLFDKSPDFGAHFNMRGQAMPDICALLSTFISSLPAPLLEAQTYSALWHWSVQPSVKREDARRDRQEEEEEERRAKGGPPQSSPWMHHTSFYQDDIDDALEGDQISIAQILLRFLPSANLSLLVYLCGFFTQLPLCPENELQLEDVARIFGHRLLGGSVKAVSQRIMLWLLTRWHRISETLFAETCGVTPPQSPSSAAQSMDSAVTTERSPERIEKRKGKQDSVLDDVLCHATSSSSSLSSPMTGSPGVHGASARKSSSDGEEEGESFWESQRRKKRELDGREARTNTSVGRPPTIRKESRHAYGHGRHGSGSHHHRHGHSSEGKSASTSPDPFAMAFAKGQQDLLDTPLLTTPSGALEGNSNEPRQVKSHIETTNRHPHCFDTPTRTPRSENDSRRTDIRSVDVLLQETAAAADVARALAERVVVLEKALQARHDGEDRVDHPGGEGGTGGRRKGDGGSEGKSEKADGNSNIEDGLRLQLRLVEAERDRAQRVVRDVRAYLLDEGSTFNVVA